MCGADSSKRCDAVHCSAACRQKAHRARSARRIGALQERPAERAVPQPIRREAAGLLQRAVADSLRRAHERVERSRELRRLSEERLRYCAAARQQCDVHLHRARTGSAVGKAPPWRGI